MPTIHPIVDEGLGNSAYVVELGDGGPWSWIRPATPPRTWSWPLAAAADRLCRRDPPACRLPDRQPGAGRRRRRPGPRPRASRLGFAHRGLEDGEEVDLGGLSLRVLATLGTPPSMSATCCWMRVGRWRCSAVGRCWWARWPAPTWPERS